jgi:hypothetical protein
MITVAFIEEITFLNGLPIDCINLIRVKNYLKYLLKVIKKRCNKTHRLNLN